MDATDNGQETARSADAGAVREPAAGPGDAGSVAGIRSETEAARALLAAIAADIGDDNQAALDAVEGQTSLLDALAAGVDRIAELDAFAAALKAREDNFAARRKRFEAQQAAIKKAIAVALDIMGQHKIELPTATIYTARGRPRAIVTDQAALPAEFLIPQEPKVDLTKLGKALAAGQIAGATLSNPSIILNIRTR